MGLQLGREGRECREGDGVHICRGGFDQQISSAKPGIAASFRCPKSRNRAVLASVPAVSRSAVMKAHMLAISIVTVLAACAALPDHDADDDRTRLPNTQFITPLAATGSTFQALNP